jgi:predicted metalloprotease with PDZ domain
MRSPRPMNCWPARCAGDWWSMSSADSLRSAAARRKQTVPLTEAIRYRIVPVDPHAHLFEITLEVSHPDAEGQRFALPAWIPGSYLLREFARHIVSIDAFAGTQRVQLRKTDKHSWHADPCPGPLRLSYRVYAWDLSVRGAHLDATHGFFNGTSVFLQVVGQERSPCEVVIERPDGRAYRDWQVATTLREAGAKRWAFGRYRAEDYDELIDHPVEMGRFAKASFEAGGVPHDIVITGRHDADLDRLCRDLAPVCAAQVALFEPESKRAPVDRYLFLITAVGDGYGGLEHRASTALICRRNDLPYPGMKGVPEGYRRLLGLASHEYFHTWNVKRIKPAVFADYDLGRENYTRLLWIFEGFTSYYDDLMLARAGLLDEAAYLEVLSGTISSVMRGPGRMLQSVADSSFDAWTRFYRQDENAPNSIVSYYTKGALVALALDLTIRGRSGGQGSLDEVMRLAWQRYGRRFYEAAWSERQGLAEDGFAELLAEATGLRLDRQIRAWADGTDDLPLEALLRPLGIKLELQPAKNGAAALGAKLAAREGMLHFAQVLNGGPAHAAGLSAGDALVAIDGLRIADERSLGALLERRPKGSTLAVHAFRRDELFQCTLSLREAPATEAKLSLDPRSKPGMDELRAGWLGRTGQLARTKPQRSSAKPRRPRDSQSP